MSEIFPNDRTFVDTQRKIIDPWLAPLKRLAPLLPLLTAENIATLKEIIAAAREQAGTPEDEDNIFNLPIDEAPLTTEDFVVGTKTSENNAGRRYPLSLFARPALLTSANLSGNSSQDFVLPSTYNNFRFLTKGISTAADAVLQMRFSSDGGANFITCGYHLFDDGGDIAGPSTGTTPDISGTMTAASNYSHIIHIYDAQTSARKLVPYHMINNVGSSAVGTIVVAGASPQPLNLVRFILSTSTFDAGTIDMWGIP